MHKLNIPAIILTATLIILGPLGGQEQGARRDVDEFKIDDSGELKIFRDLVIPEGEIRQGNLRVIGANLTVAGTVSGKIIVIGGDVHIESTATIEGVIVALGGNVTRDPMAKITGEILEVNLGKVSLSREYADTIFDRDRDEDDEMALSNRLDYGFRYWDRPVSTHKYTWQRNSFRSRLFTDMEVPGDFVARYNRAEGLAIYVPLDLDTDDIEGFHVLGYGGRAFGPQRWYGRLAISQYLFQHRLGLIVEGHLEPRNDDGWRVSSGENMIGALLLREDWYDWYETEGYGGSVVAYPLSGVSLMARYRNESHHAMDRTVSWSMFGSDKTFRPGYGITPGQDISLGYHLRVGDYVGLFQRRFTFSLTASYTQSLPGSTFDYIKEDLAANFFVPLQRRIGIRGAIRTGATRNAGAGGFGLQHTVPLGGVGSLGGYSYKDRIGSHYALINVAFTLNKRRNLAALLWQYGTVWNAAEGLFGGDYFQALGRGGRHSIGIRLGDDDARLEVFRPLTGDKKEIVVYYRLMDF